VRGVRGDFPSYSLRWVWRLAGFPALDNDPSAESSHLADPVPRRAPCVVQNRPARIGECPSATRFESTGAGMVSTP